MLYVSTGIRAIGKVRASSAPAHRRDPAIAERGDGRGRTRARGAAAGALLALLLSGCASEGWINREHPHPGSAASRAAVEQCGKPEWRWNRRMTRYWGLKLLVNILIMPFGVAGPPIDEYYCDDRCFQERRAFETCMDDGGWIRCKWTGRWLCQRRPD